MLTFLAEQGLVNLDHLSDSTNLGKLGRKAKDEMENYFPKTVNYSPGKKLLRS
jgi:hypothetical protein